MKVGIVQFDYHAAFREGGRFAEIVAARLQADGVNCFAPPIQIARTQQEREHMTMFETDIVFDWLKQGLEVKSSSRIFGDVAGEYPFDTLFVDTVSGFDAKVVKPVAYIFVSQKGGGMLCLSPKTKPDWKIVDAFDSKRQINDCFYSVHKSKLQTYASLVRWLAQKQRESGHNDTSTD
jgi:hypothetical protein